MTAQVEKFYPQRGPDTAAYWDACQQHQLLIQCCDNCGTNQFYPRSICASCSSRSLNWVAAKGQGNVISWTIVRRAVSAAYADDVPYVIALIELIEGVVMMSKVTGCDPETVHTGMAVEVSFEDWSEQVSMPVFIPLNTTAGQ
jgi:uncharacterized OB-fold protein